MASVAASRQSSVPAANRLRLDQTLPLDDAKCLLSLHRRRANFGNGSHCLRRPCGAGAIAVCDEYVKFCRRKSGCDLLRQEQGAIQPFSSAVAVLSLFLPSNGLFA